jgi:hypothetical protein
VAAVNDEPPRLATGLLPIPDPTTLTTAALLREVAALKEVVQLADKRIEDLLRTEIALVLSKLEKSDSVSSERFDRIDVQFIERDKRTEQLSLASSTAIAAALQAAKEAVGEQNRSSALAIAKSENSTTEALRQLQTLFQTASKGTDDKINDLKGRLDRGEGIHTGGRDVWGYVIGAIGLAIAAISVIVLAASHFAIVAH